VSLRLDKSPHLGESTCSTCHQLFMCYVQLLPWLAHCWFSSRPRRPLPSTLTQSYHIKFGDKLPLRSWQIRTPHRNMLKTAHVSSLCLIPAKAFTHTSLIYHLSGCLWDASIDVAIRNFQGWKVRLLGKNSRNYRKGWIDTLISNWKGFLPFKTSCHILNVTEYKFNDAFRCQSILLPISLC